MSAATAASPTVARTTSRRQQSYTSPTLDRHQRTPSSSARTPTTPGESYRPESYSQGHSRGPSAPQQALAGVARRDYETTNVARPPSSRRSSSRDRPYVGPPPTSRTDNGRSTHRSSSRPSNSRYSSDMTGPTNATTNGGPTSNPASSAGLPPQGSSNTKKRTTINTATGQWSLGKTIGAGSMGKVKLAKNMETGEQVAIKIVPRQSTDEHHSVRDRERADHSKEIRTAREAAIVTLLNHPYICGMRDVVRTSYHWYMLFEYVNGGQMLDYIISHGRLKEKQARKFGRQIASALDYCHRNSIVHRDLKIENILISKTGDIKIIDFGLSNLFSPRNHLKTFCGSLYFAAPELLQAKQYTGPEVDIWSFGIVLYVLVCGKVPFDDQSMPQLHAKIMKGVVDYPNWLSQECRHLISRMLVTDPKQRATLGEIMNHPWITKGFNTPPENYLPQREPLQLPLDSAVVEKMTGFDFGSAEFITRELTRVLESEDYQSAVRLSTRDNSNPVGSEKKRGVFDFYKRRNSTTSRDTLPNMSSEAVQLGADPVNAFSPLISVYYLVREKQERERMEANPGALSLPQHSGEKPLKITDLPPPPAAYTNTAAYEMPGEKATGGRSRPRARTQGEDEVQEDMKKLRIGTTSGQVSPAIVTTPAPQQPSTKKESMAGGLLRRFSTRRTKDPTRDRVETASPPTLQLQPPTDAAAPPRKSFSVRRSRNKEASLSPMIHSAGVGSTPYQAPELLTPTSGGAVSRAGSKILGRSTSVNSADYRRSQPRRGVSEGLTTATAGDPPLTSGSERSSVSGAKVKMSEPSPVDDKSSPSTRASTSRTKSLGHARRESIQARRAHRSEKRQSNLPEETGHGLASPGDLTDNGEGQSEMKPVYLKGLFSVSTTSNKPLPVIRKDIIRVLRQLGVTYTDIRGGFSCRHAPSIDLKTVNDKSPISPDPPSYQSPTHRRRISFGGFMGGGSDRDRDDTRDISEKSPQLPRSASRRRAPDASFTNSDDSEDEMRRRPGSRPAAGETTTHVESDTGENMVLKFEIFIVKVPLFSLHGIQFKKVSGGTWQYKNMAQKILDALRL